MSRMKLIITFLIAVLIAGGIWPARSSNGDRGVPLADESGEITAEEFRAALELLGLSLQRFSFTVPYEHSIRYRVSAFVAGKEQEFGHGSYQGRSAGKHVLSILAREAEGKLDLTVKCIAVEGTPSYGLAGSTRYPPLSVKGYPARGTSQFSNVRLEVGKEVPIWLLAAGSVISSIGTGESVADYAKRTDLVVVVYVTLVG